MRRRRRPKVVPRAAKNVHFRSPIDSELCFPPVDHNISNLLKKYIIFPMGPIKKSYFMYFGNSSMLS